MTWLWTAAARPGPRQTLGVAVVRLPLSAEIPTALTGPPASTAGRILHDCKFPVGTKFTSTLGSEGKHPLGLHPDVAGGPLACSAHLSPLSLQAVIALLLCSAVAGQVGWTWPSRPGRRGPEGGLAGRGVILQAGEWREP